MNSNICVILVLYNPNKQRLTNLFRSIMCKGLKIFIFDNSIDNVYYNFEEELGEGNYEYFSSKENVGIAAAQNILLSAARNLGYKFALMSDQDTIYPENYIIDLFRNCPDNINYAAICPSWWSIGSINESDEVQRQFCFDNNGNLRLIEIDDNQILLVSHAISSGMILNIEVLDHVGLMNEKLFIDWVDNDWCWRAKKLDYNIVYVSSVKIEHSLGDEQVSVLGMPFVKRSSFRNYYIIRNAIYLIFYSRHNRSIKFYLLKKVLQHSVFAIIVTQTRITEISFIIKAFSDAILL